MWQEAHTKLLLSMCSLTFIEGCQGDKNSIPSFLHRVLDLLKAAKLFIEYVESHIRWRLRRYTCVKYLSPSSHQVCMGVTFFFVQITLLKLPMQFLNANETLSIYTELLIHPSFYSRNVFRAVPHPITHFVTFFSYFSLGEFYIYLETIFVALKLISILTNARILQLV